MSRVHQDSTVGDGTAQVRQHLQANHRLWVDPRTAAYLVEQCGEEASMSEQVRFIAACARTGRSAFQTLPASALMPAKRVGD